MIRKISNVMIVMSAFCVLALPVHADDLQPKMHTLVDRYYGAGTKGEKWEADKATLVGYNSEQLVRALIVELDLNRGSPQADRHRDISAYSLFHALDLPPALLCQELNEPQQLPDRKASLAFVLRHTNKPEVVQALLRQLGDRRYVTLPPVGKPEHGELHPYRVRDIVFNSLVDNVDNANLRRPALLYSEKFNDEIIQDGLEKLKLPPPG